VFSGLNHSLEIQAWGRARMPRSSSSSWRLPRQSSSQVPPTVTSRSFRRSPSNCSSGRAAQGNFRRGMVLFNLRGIRRSMVSRKVTGDNRRAHQSSRRDAARIPDPRRMGDRPLFSYREAVAVTGRVGRIRLVLPDYRILLLPGARRPVLTAVPEP
jgi:hypothetical protein